MVPNDDDYVFQAHQISRSAYSMPTVQRRLVHLVMAQVQIRGDGFELLEMTVGDIARALKMTNQGNCYADIRQAVKGLMGVVLDVDTAEGWLMCHWIDTARYIKSRDVVQFRVSPDLLPYVLEVKDMWRIFALADMTKLQGKYAWRVFEWVMADRGHAGTKGNKPGCWFTDLLFADVRFLLHLSPDEYQVTAELRRNIIDYPLREINEAGLGLHITADYEKHRHGRRLDGVRLHCQLLNPGEPRNVTPATVTEITDGDLIEKNKKRFEEILGEVRSQTDLPGIPWVSPAMKNLAQEAEALTRLKAEQKPKRGRPKKND